MIKTWRNGAKGEEVKAIIDYNFKVVSKALNKYIQDIEAKDWSGGNIVIPYSKHDVENPSVQLFIKNNNSFAPVLGGIEVDSAYNVTLFTDLPFDGRVVIK